MTGYVYDAEGRRVAKGTITSWSCDPSTNGLNASLNETDYVLDPEGHQVTEMASDANGAMTWAHTNVWAGGQLLATYDATTDASGQQDGALHFYLDDWLGSRRAQTDYAGIWEQDCASLPFGDQLNCTQSTTQPTEHHFTGKERDQESGNDYFPFRYYASTMGRWLSPDPTGGQLGDPQTLNRYAYVGNNPLHYIDPLGLAHCEGGSGSTQDACNSGGGMWALDPGDPGYGGSGGATPNGGTASLSFGGNNGGGSSSGGSGGGSSDGGGGGGGGDVPIDNPWGLAAFGPSSLGTWTAANNTVKIGAAATVVMYGGAAFAPEIVSGVSSAGSTLANASGSLGPALGRVFWSGTSSGGAAAVNYLAEHPGTTTLETTPLGRVASYVQNLRFVPQNSFTYSAWSWLSTAYAQGAEGTATYFQGAGGYQGQIWLNYELPTLVQKGVPIVTVPHP